MRSMTCPDCQGARLNPAPGRPRRRQDARRARRDADRPRSAGSSTTSPGVAAPDIEAADECPTPLDPLSRTIAEELLKEIRGRLGVPDRRRPALPDARPRGADALRRRGPADPPGQPGRRGAGGRALHPRRAVDRPAPARQRPAARRPSSGSATSATRSSSSSTTRTRCARPTTSSTSARARASRGARSSPRGRSTTSPRSPQSLTGQYLSGQQAIAIPERAQGARRPDAHGRRRPAEQPQGYRRLVPARPVRLRDGRLAARARARWSATSSARPWRATSTARSPSPACTTGSTGSTSSTRSSTSTSRRSAGPRARTRRRTSSCST